jgi:hypothetical protein
MPFWVFAFNNNKQFFGIHAENLLQLQSWVTAKILDIDISAWFNVFKRIFNLSLVIRRNLFFLALSKKTRKQSKKTPPDLALTSTPQLQAIQTPGQRRTFHIKDSAFLSHKSQCKEQVPIRGKKSIKELATTSYRWFQHQKWKLVEWFFFQFH